MDVDNSVSQSNDSNEQMCCVACFSKRVTIPLLPSSLGGELKAIKSFLNKQWMRKYVKELNGFLVTFKNIELIGESGYISDDLPIVFWDITADFQVFRPEKDALIKGVVINSTFSHVHCSVFGDIRASIKVRDESHDYKRFLRFGKTIYFKVDESNLSSGVVKGKIDEECIQKMKQISSNEDDGEEETSEYNNEIGDESNFDDFFS